MTIGAAGGAPGASTAGCVVAIVSSLLLRLAALERLLHLAGSEALERDLLRLGLGALRRVQAQHALFERRLDRVGVVLVAERHRVPVAALAALARDRELARLERQVEV